MVLGAACPNPPKDGNCVEGVVTGTVGPKPKGMVGGVVLVAAPNEGVRGALLGAEPIDTAPNENGACWEGGAFTNGAVIWEPNAGTWLV